VSRGHGAERRQRKQQQQHGGAADELEWHSVHVDSLVCIDDKESV
jgi:hypothetical protein